MEESITLDSGEGTLENSVNQMPRPPPRHESYMLSSTLGTDGSGSENYEMLPTRSLNSLNGKLNAPVCPPLVHNSVVSFPPHTPHLPVLSFLVCLQKKEIYH